MILSLNHAKIFLHVYIALNLWLLGSLWGAWRNKVLVICRENGTISAKTNSIITGFFSVLLRMLVFLCCSAIDENN